MFPEIFLRYQESCEALTSEIVSFLYVITQCDFDVIMRCLLKTDEEEPLKAEPLKVESEEEFILV